MSTARWDLLAILLTFAVACLILWQRHRHALRKLDVARYHAHADILHWGKTSLLGRKMVRVCPDCGPLIHDYKSQTLHHEFHLYIYALEDRIAALEKLAAEARGGGPVEETPAIPWDGLTGELVEHAGAIDVTAEELEARADEPEPEQVLAFRERFKDLIKP